MNPKYATREQWLNGAVNLFRGIFAAANYELTDVRVSCGWPSKGALAAKKRRIGECWPSEASKDGFTEIFISPFLSDPRAKDGVLATLAHELVHAAVGLEAKHGKRFRKCALAVGLEGKMTATFAGEGLMSKLAACADDLGDYPHATLDLTKRPTKRETCRMVKCECDTCGFVVRTTRKWLDQVGAPHCPKHGAMSFEVPGELKGRDNDDHEESESENE